MVSIVPGCHSAPRLSVTTCFILKSNPVLVPHVTYLIALPVSTCSPMGKYSLRLPCSMPRLRLFILPSALLSLIGNFVFKFSDFVSESQISLIFIAFVVCPLWE